MYEMIVVMNIIGEYLLIIEANMKSLWFSGIYINLCEPIDIKEFIARFNNNSDSVKLVSIQSIDLYMRRIKELDEKSTQIKNDRHPDNEQSIELEL